MKVNYDIAIYRRRIDLKKRIRGVIRDCNTLGLVMGIKGIRRNIRFHYEKLLTFLGQFIYNKPWGDK